MTVAEYNLSVDDYADKLYRFILKNLRSEDEAKDIVQETYSRLWQKVSEVDSLKVKSYLFTTAYHAMIDHLRKNRFKADFKEVKQDSQVYNHSYSDLSEILNEAVSMLPDVQRSVIMLRDYEGYSYDEISEITGLTESQVKVYIYRGRVFLKKYIGSIETVI